MITIPKIIDDVKNTILSEARSQVFENGFQNMTIRSVAKECNVAVGTIYNYFPSKDILTASFMLEDWLSVLNKMKLSSDRVTDPSECFRCIYSYLVDFNEEYSALFNDSNAMRISAVIFPKKHRYVRSQIAGLIKEICIEKAKNYTYLLPEFIAESLLSWSLENKPFDELEPILTQLF